MMKRRKCIEFGRGAVFYLIRGQQMIWEQIRVEKSGPEDGLKFNFQRFSMLLEYN